MGRSMLVLVRLSIIAGGLAVLFLCVRAARAQPVSQLATPVSTQQSRPYGFAPVENAVPSPQPYGIKPIPGYTPPPASPVQSPPKALRGAYESTPNSGSAQPYGYVPLPDVKPVSRAPAYGTSKQPALDDNSPAHYGSQTLIDPMDYYQNPKRMNRLHAAYRLGPGDKIRVTVFGETDLSGEYQVDGSGMVRLPLIGTLRAKGDTAQALEASITAALADGYLKQPRVNVEVMTYRPFYIIGAVNRPGEYPYVENMSAMNAVALAGGFTDQAVQGTIYVRHEGSTVEHPVETKDLTRIRPGDVIRVRTSLFWQAMNVFTPIAGPAALAVAAFH